MIVADNQGQSKAADMSYVQCPLPSSLLAFFSKRTVGGLIFLLYLDVSALGRPVYIC